MKKTFAIAALALATTPQIYAQATNFEGFSVAGGLMSVSSTLDSVMAGTATGSGSATDGVGAVQAQYNLAFGSNFTLGAGVMAALGDAKATAGPARNKGITLAYLAPAYAVSNNVLVYAKLGSLNYQIDSGRSETGSYSTSATVYGVGGQFLVNKNMFIQAEYVQGKPSEGTATGTLGRTTLTPGTTGLATLLIGYKF